MLPKSIDWNKDEKRRDGGAVEALKHFPQAAESTAEIRSAQSKKPPESTAEIPAMPSAQ